MKVIDHATGEIVEDEGFVSLEEAEAALFSSIGTELDSKLAQVRVLLRIQDSGLYRQRTDEDGRVYSSMQSYLKSLEPRLAAIGAGKSRSLLSWMQRHRIFVQQLGKPETILRELGTHLDLLMPAAARHDPTGQLLDVDDPTENGIRLGKERFSQLTDFIEEKVRESESGIPEQSWGVKDTKATVDEWMQRTTEERPSISIDAVWSGGDKVKIQGMCLWIGDFMYQLPSDLIPISHFKQWARSFKVEGLGESWKD